MLKRRLGETLTARGFHRQNRATLLKVVTHNILILLRVTRFSTEQCGRRYGHSVSTRYPIRP